MPPCDLAYAFQITGLRQHDSNIGERWLDKHAGNIAKTCSTFQCCKIIERHDSGGELRVDLRSDSTTATDGAIPHSNNQRLIDRAVIAPVMHQHFGFASDSPSKAQQETIGVGGTNRKLPFRQTESTRQLIGHPSGIWCWQHCSAATGELSRNGGIDLTVGMTSHCPGIAEAQVDIFVAVDIGKARTTGCIKHHRKRPRPAAHPRHRHPCQQCGRRRGVCPRFWVRTHEPLCLAEHQCIKA